MTYRILITGSRHWVDTVAVDLELHRLVGRYLTNDVARSCVVVVHGACDTGADKIAEEFCQRHHVATEPHPALWKKGGIFDPAAGPRRNTKMVSLGANICLAFWDGRVANSGTHDCFTKASRAGIRVVVVPHNPNQVTP